MKAPQAFYHIFHYSPHRICLPVRKFLPRPKLRILKLAYLAPAVFLGVSRTYMECCWPRLQCGTSSIDVSQKPSGEATQYYVPVALRDWYFIFSNCA